MQNFGFNMYKSIYDQLRIHNHNIVGHCDNVIFSVTFNVSECSFITVERLRGTCGHSFFVCSNLNKALRIRFYTTYDIPFRPSLIWKKSSTDLSCSGFQSKTMNQMNSCTLI